MLNAINVTHEFPQNSFSVLIFFQATFYRITSRLHFSAKKQFIFNLFFGGKKHPQMHFTTVRKTAKNYLVRFQILR
jgi:hypothetical protein